MLKQVIETIELLDDPDVKGKLVADLLKSRGLEGIVTETVRGETGTTDFIKVVVPGREGKTMGGSAPTLGIIGRLGGVGARPERIGMVSDADGAVVAVSCALKLADMRTKGDIARGDIVIATHISPRSPIIPHDPVPFMGSPVSMRLMNEHEVDPAMEAILSVDSTKGNRILNHRGIAISPTVKQGYILRVSEDLLEIMTWTTGMQPHVLAITMQDITPYGNGIFHVNSIMQPCTATTAPVVGLATTAETAVPGCAGGANHEGDIEAAGRYCLEVAKAFGDGRCRFYDEEEFMRMLALYGPMDRLQTTGAVR
jgi:hypothetical protein